MRRSISVSVVATAAKRSIGHGFGSDRVDLRPVSRRNGSFIALAAARSIVDPRRRSFADLMLPENYRRPYHISTTGSL